MTDETFPFGDLDGERVDAAVAKFAGEHRIERRYQPEESVILIAEARVGVLPTFKRDTGKLIRVEKLTIASMIVLEEGAEQVLAREVRAAIDEAEELRTGAAKLPLEDEPDDEPTAEAENPEQPVKPGDYDWDDDEPDPEPAA